MTKQQKIDRIERFHPVIEYPCRTIRYTAGKYEAKNIYQLHKQIYGY